MRADNALPQNLFHANFTNTPSAPSSHRIPPRRCTARTRVKTRAHTSAHSLTHAPSIMVHPSPCLLKLFVEGSLAVSRGRRLFSAAAYRTAQAATLETTSDPGGRQPATCPPNNTVDCVCRNLSSPFSALILWGKLHRDLLPSGSKVSILQLFPSGLLHLMHYLNPFPVCAFQVAIES